MKRLTTWAIAACLGVTLGTTPVAVSAQGTPPVLAVVPFEDGGSHGRADEEFAGLRRSIAAVLGGELARLSAGQVVGREDVARLLKAEGLLEAARLDGGTVARIGKTAGARFVVAGTFIDLYGDVRVDARLVDADNGTVLKVVRSDPKLTDRGQFYRIIRSVAERIVETGGFGPGGAASQPPRNLTTEALTDFGRGLLHMDRGDVAQAEELLGKAVASSPDFDEAREALAALRRRP